MQSVRLFLSSLVGSCSANSRGRRIGLASLLAALTLPLQAQEGGTLSFTSSIYSHSERDPGAVITVTRDTEWAPVEVDVVITEVTATNNVHFSITSLTNTLRFENFQRNASFGIQLVNNANQNTNATSVTATLRLENARAVTNQFLTLAPVISTSLGEATLEIKDDDIPNQANLELTAYAAFEGTSGLINVVLTTPVPDDAEEPLEVDYVVEVLPEGAPTRAESDYAEANDFEAQSGTLTFAPGGDPVAAIALTVTEDMLIEFNEDFQVRLTGARGGMSPEPEPPAEEPSDIEPLAAPAAPVPYSVGAISTATVTILFDGSEMNYQPAGSVDQTYNPENSSETTPPYNPLPGANNAVYSIVALDDGSSIMVGDFTSVNATPRGRIAKVLPDGMLDPEFLSTPGANDFIWTAVVYEDGGPHDGKILVGGGFTSINGVARSGLARLNPDGSVDQTFNPGTGTDGPVYAISIEPGGAIQIGGDFFSYDGISVGRFTRLSENGTLDVGYNASLGEGFDGAVFAIETDLPVPVEVEATVIDQDPARFSTNVFIGGTSGVVYFEYDFSGETNDFLILQGGNVVFASGLTNHPVEPTIGFAPFQGTADSLEFIVNSGGTNENRNFSFSASIELNNVLGTIVAGDFQEFDGMEVGRIARLSPAGTLDEQFTLENGIGADNTIYSLARQSTGGIVLGGAFSTINSFVSPGVARLNIDGSFDRTFNVGQGADDIVYDIAVQSDDGILVAGSFWSFNHPRRTFLARLLENGALDTSFLDPAFNQYAGFVSPVTFFPEGYLQTVAVEPSGNVLVGGLFSRVGGGFTRDDLRPRINFARLHSHSENPDPAAFTPAPGNMSFTAEQFGGDENGGLLNFLLVRTNGTLGGSEVVLATRDGAAVSEGPEADYEGTTNAVSWPVASPAQSVGVAGIMPHFITLLDDEEIEGDENFFGIISEPQGILKLGGAFISTAPALGETVQTTGLILENDREVSYVVFSRPEYDFDENGGSVTVQVHRYGGTGRAASVRYRSEVPTDAALSPATEGQDYLRASGTVPFPSGQTNLTITLALLDDDIVEPDESFQLRLFSPSPGLVIGTNALGTNGIAHVHIIDNDYQPGRATFEVSDVEVVEGGIANVVVKRTGGNLGLLQVQYSTADGTAAAGLDYEQRSGTLLWNDKQSASKVISVPIGENIDVDGTKTFDIILSDALPSGGLGLRTNVTVSIVDNDESGTFQFNALQYLADEIGGSVTINVIRTDGAAGEASVDFDTYSLSNVVAGVDYVLTNGTLTFGPGEVSKSFQVRLMDNLDVNSAEMLVGLILTNPAPEGAMLGSITNAQIAIIDNESVNIPAGSVETDFNTGSGANAPVHALAVASNGKILLGGDFTIVNRQVRSHLARLNVDGSLDPFFGTDYEFNGPVRAIDLQNDGRILLAGFFTKINDLPFNRVARFTSAGMPDTTFNPGSGADGNVYAIEGVEIGGQKKILIGGNFSMYNGVSRKGIARIDFDGRADVTFNPGTGVSGVVYAMAVQPDGKILIGGEFTSVDGSARTNLARLHANGSLDTSFDLPEGLDGAVRAIAVQYDGKIVIGGLFTNVDGVPQARLARLNEDGTLDTGYLVGTGSNGAVLALAVQLDGKMVVAGDFTSFNGVPANRIVRLTLDGTIDTTANFGLGADASINALAVQPNRQIVIGGAFSEVDGYPRSGFARLYGGSIAGPGEIYFGAPTFAVNESSTNVVISVRRYGGLEGQISAEYATEAITASPGADYLDVSGVVTFEQGENVKTFNIPILDDTSVEPLESVRLILTNEVGSLPLRIQPLSLLTISSDDSLIGFAEPAYDVPENAPQGRARITLTREGETAIPLVVRVRTQNGTATAGQDYAAEDAQVTFAPGETSKFVNVTIFEDAIVEENETVMLTLEAVTPEALIGRSAVTLQILDNDFAPGIISLGEVSSVSEDAGFASIPVNRVSGRTGTVTVQYRVIAEEATLNADYQLPSLRTVTFQEGETLQFIQIPLVNDEAIEGAESFRIEIFGPGGGAQLGTPVTRSVTILDDDVGPGSVDLTFNVGSGADGAVRDLEIQPDGKIVLGGEFESFNSFDFGGIVRLNADGSIDLSFSPAGGTDGVVQDIDFGPGGSIVAAGNFTRFGSVNRWYAARFATNGFPYVNLNRSASENGPFTALAVQADGKMIVGGDFTVPAGRIIRLTQEGTLDVDFNSEGGANGPILALALQDDGRILVGGDFNRIAVQNMGSIVRLKPNGGIDFTFNTGAGANGAVHAIEVLSDGKILIAGDFTSVNGVPRSRVARLNANGSVDETFDPVAIGGTVFDVAVDGRFVYIGGDFNTVGGESRMGVARLMRWGGLDEQFNVGAGPNGTVFGLDIQEDGQLLIAGDFTAVNGVLSPGIARVNGRIGSLPPQAEISSVEIDEAGVVTLTFSSEPGLNYSVQVSEDLRSWTELTTVTAQEFATTITHESEPAQARFYRILIEE